MKSSRPSAEANPALRTHLLTIEEEGQFNSKTAYALACLASALAPTNSSRLANVAFLAPHLSSILQIAASVKDCSQIHLLNLLRVVNPLRREGVSQEQEALMLKVVGAVSVGEGQVGEELSQEIVSFSEGMGDQVESQETLLRILAGKMTARQILTFLSSLPQEKLHRVKFQTFVSLAQAYPQDESILLFSLQGIHWLALNQPKEGKSSLLSQIAPFLESIVKGNSSSPRILSSCSLIYFSLPPKSVQNGNLDRFLRGWVETPSGQIYLQGKVVQSFQDVTKIVEAKGSIGENIDFHLLLNHYARTSFPWRSELEGWQTKREVQKELLLRATQSFQKTAERKSSITVKEQMQFLAWLPAVCLRSVQALSGKVQRCEPCQAVEIINILKKINRKHPHFEELVILLVEKAVRNRHFESLSQIDRIVVAEVEANTVVKKLQEKASVHKIDSNRKSKAYFALVPLLLSKVQVQLEVLEEVAQIFGYETIPIQLKLYVGQFLLRKMIEKPLQKLGNFIIRQLESVSAKECLQELLWYMKRLEKLSKATKEWAQQHFGELGERLMEIIFAKLMGSDAGEAAQVLFQLQKLGVYGSSWIPAYRWVLLALEKQASDTLTLDYLQLFEMLVQKVGEGCLPGTVAQKFERVISDNWHRYTHEHFFTIQRIVQILNESSMTTFRKNPLVSLSELFMAQKVFGGTGQLDPVSQYLRNLSWNLVFQHIQSGSGIKLLLSIVLKLEEEMQGDPSLLEGKLVLAMQMILYVYEDQGALVEKEVDQLVMRLIGRVGEGSGCWLTSKLTLEYLSKVPHSINILKLPISHFLSRGFSQKEWIVSITDLLEMVVESKPKAIGGFQLQNLLRGILIRLISLENQPMQEYLDLLDLVLSTEGDYQTFLDQHIHLFERILYAERQGIGYRPSLVKYVLQTLLDFQSEISKETIHFLLCKYANDPDVVKLLLDWMEIKQWQKTQFDQQIMLSLVLTHTQEEQIQSKIKAIFNTVAPPSSAEKQFMSDFADGNYASCEEMLPKIVNPFGLDISLPEVRALMEWKSAASSARKLIRFLYDHPEANGKVHACPPLYLNKDFIPILADTLSLLKEEPSLHKFQSSSGKGYCCLKRVPLPRTIFETLSSIILSKGDSSKFKSHLVDIFRHEEDAVATISQLLLIVFRDMKALGDPSASNISVFFNFFREVVGGWELISKERVERLNLRDLIHIFPFSLGEVGLTSLHYSSTLAHYASLVLNWGVVKKEIGLDRYLKKVLEAILTVTKGDDGTEKVIEKYMALHIRLEGKSEMVWEAKQTEMKRVHIQFLSSMMGRVNSYVEGKVSNPSQKVDPSIVSGYVTTLLHSVSGGFQVDPPALEKLGIFQQNIDHYSFSETSKNAIKKAVEWLLQKKPSKQAVSEQRTPPVVIDKVEIIEKVEKPILQERKVEAEKEKPAEQKEEERMLQSYASMRPQDSEERDQTQLKKEAQQSYLRFKETEQNVTVVEKEEESKTSLFVFQGQPPAVEINKEIEEENYAEEQVSQDIQGKGPCQEERRKNLEAARTIESGQYSIQSLKDHCRFIASLADLPLIDSNQFAQLLVSLDSVAETVRSHTFYVKKVHDHETVFKLMRIWKNLVASGQKAEARALNPRILNLCGAMADKKEKKMQLFADEETIQFLKRTVKKALNGEPSGEELTILLQILFSCRANTDAYYKGGLFSMVLELVNRDLSPGPVIDYLIRIDLNAHLINEIYQRGLFNKLVEALSSEARDEKERALLNLWIKLAGKVCISKAIQDRFRGKDLHGKAWQLLKGSSSTTEKLNLCYFYAYLSIKNQPIAEWLMQSKAAEELLASLRSVPANEELYLFFYHFCFGNSVARDYCFRLKYHSHLLERLGRHEAEQTPLSKYFFKSLGQMMGSRLQVPTFLKEETVAKLIEYNTKKSEPTIFECLLDFVGVLESSEEFDQLKRQNFWSSLKLFEFKMSSEATYSYLLQIFLVMVKKGRTREFNQPEVRNKVCLKAEYSINMEGKELALRFILALCLKNKENYLTERCVKLLVSILGLRVSSNELQILHDMLRIEGSTKKIQFLGYFATHNVDGLIIDSLHTLPAPTLALAFRVLTILSVYFVNNQSICFKIVPLPPRIAELIREDDVCKETISLLAVIANNLDNAYKLAEGKFTQSLITQPFLETVKQKKLSQELSQMLMKMVTNGVIEKEDMGEVLRNAEGAGVELAPELVERQKKGDEERKGKVDLAGKSMRSGRKVRMFKTDGSVSQLFIFVSSDYLELNCGLRLSEVVKQKWRLPLNEINKVVLFSGQESADYLSSLFEKNSGFFSKTPPFEQCVTLEGKNNDFHICFESKEEREEWMGWLEVLRQNSAHLFSQLK